MNPFTKKGLGRGLSSLIGDLPSSKTKSNRVLIANLKPNKNQTRKKENPWIQKIKLTA